MKTNLGKCHLLLNTNQNKLVNGNSNAIHNSSSDELLGITTGTYLNFDIDVNNLCKKTFQKLNALTRIVSLVNVEKRRTVNESLHHFAF